jgi:thioesterase domain-containing protein
MLTDTQRAALAARLRQGRTRAPATTPASPVVPFPTAGAVSAFAIHAVGGSVHEYAHLARALDGTCGLIGIEAGGLRPGTAPLSTLAEMADRYADVIRTHQPEGTYRLVGWSMGGVLAYETARRLEAAGARVALVALIDAPYRPVASYAPTPEALTALFVTDALRAAVPPESGPNPADTTHADPATTAPRPDRPVLPASGAVAAPTARVLAELSIRDQLDLLATRLAPDPAERVALAEELDRRHAVFVAHTSALAGYLPDGPVDAAGILISAHGSPDSAPEWGPLFGGGAHVTIAAADHYACLRPPAVTATAATIRAALPA